MTHPQTPPKVPEITPDHFRRRAPNGLVDWPAVAKSVLVTPEGPEIIAFLTMLGARISDGGMQFGLRSRYYLWIPPDATGSYPFDIIPSHLFSEGLDRWQEYVRNLREEDPPK